MTWQPLHAFNADRNRPAAGPVMNLLLASLAALAFHIVAYFLPATTAQWRAENLRNAILINVVLVIFNLLPIPPPDGGRIAVGLLPKALGNRLSRVEPYGLLLLIGLFFILPSVGAQLGFNLEFVS